MQTVAELIQATRENLKDVRLQCPPLSTVLVPTISDDHLEIIFSQFSNRTKDPKWLSRVQKSADEEVFPKYESPSIATCNNCKLVQTKKEELIDAFNIFVVFKARSFLDILIVRAAWVLNRRLIIGTTNPFEPEEGMCTVKIEGCTHSLVREEKKNLKRPEALEFLAYSVLKTDQRFSVGFLCFLMHLKTSGFNRVDDPAVCQRFMDAFSEPSSTKSISTLSEKSESFFLRPGQCDTESNINSILDIQSVKTARTTNSGNLPSRITTTHSVRDKTFGCSDLRPLIEPYQRLVPKKSPQPIVISSSSSSSSTFNAPNNPQLKPSAGDVLALLKEFSRVMDMQFYEIAYKNTTVVDLPVLTIPPDVQKTFFLKYAPEIFGGGTNLNALLMTLQQLFRGCNPEFNFKRNVEATPLDFIYLSRTVLSVTRGALRGCDPLRIKQFLAVYFLILISPRFSADLLRYLIDPDAFLTGMSNKAKDKVTTMKSFTNKAVMNLLACKGIRLSNFLAKFTSAMINGDPLSDKAQFQLNHNPVSFLKEYMDGIGIVQPLANNFNVYGTSKVYKARYSDKFETIFLDFEIIFDTSINKTTTFKALSIVLISLLFEQADLGHLEF
jgi:hypothetical protein